MAARSKKARKRAAQQGALVRKVRAGVRGALAELLRRFPERGREIQAEARKRAAQQGALVRKVRAGVRGALAELLRRFPERGREIQAERRKAPTRPTKSKPARKPKSKKPKPKSQPKQPVRKKSQLAEAKARAEAAEAKARAEKERADRLEREFQEALRKDREEREHVRRQRAEAREREAASLGFPSSKKHAPYTGPAEADLREVERRLRDRDYGPMKVHAPRRLRTRDGEIMTGYAIDPATGARILLRGYEIRMRRESARGVSEESYVFWGVRKGIERVSPAVWFEEDLYAGTEREPWVDMIVAWKEKPVACARCGHSRRLHKRGRRCRDCSCPRFESPS